MRLSGDDRIAATLELLRAVSRETEPNQAVRAFGRHYMPLNRVDWYVSLSVRGLGPGEYKITRSTADGQARSALSPQNPWDEWAKMPVLRGGFLGEVIENGGPQLLRHLDIRADPVLGDELVEMGSAVVVPLLDGGEALNWSLTFRRDPEGFDEEDMAQSLLVSNLVGAMTKNLVAVKEVKRLNASLTAQFEEVARVQQSLLPAIHPTIAGLRIATSYLPSDLAGGDYYDFFELPDGRWGFLIADVSGHGVAAATIMAMLHAILHSYPHLDRGPGAVMEWANSRLAAANMDSSFVTAVFAIYDPATRRLGYARAGHPPPLVKDGRTGSVYPLEGAASVPLGIASDYDVAEASVTLRPGDTVVLYTDGITEAFAPDRKTMFGVVGLERALEACTGDPDCVVDTVHTALFKHTSVLTRTDDQTLVALRVVEGT